MPDFQQFLQRQLDAQVGIAYPSTQWAAPLWSMLAAQQVELSAWLPWAKSIQSLGDARAFLQEIQAQGQGQLHLMVLWESQLAGMIGLRPIPQQHLQAELSYWLGPAYQGRGIARRASQALLDYGFGRLGLHRVQIATSPDNHRSCALAKRLGFRYEGLHRQAYWLGEAWADVACYALLHSEWAERQ